jgi:aminoglycoside N3'-acetyltransferase
MRPVTLEQLVCALRAVGIQAGDGLLVHSALQYLGAPEGGIGLYYAGIHAVLEAIPAGESSKRAAPSQNPALTRSTLAVPTFNFAFARGEPYDPLTAPSAGMGAFSEYVRQLPQARRTPHPMQSLAVVGQHAADLAGRDTPSAFDPGSSFERLLELDFKLLLLGADIQAVSMLHYSEQRLKVPYRYWKDFSGQVRTPQGWQERTYRMFVRDLELDPRIELYPVQRLLEQRGQWSSTALNYGQVACCRLVDFIAALDKFLQLDPWSLVTNPPAHLRD